MFKPMGGAGIHLCILLAAFDLRTVCALIDTMIVGGKHNIVCVEVSQDLCLQRAEAERFVDVKRVDCSVSSPGREQARFRSIS
jgi:hypothetical protein